MQKYDKKGQRSLKNYDQECNLRVTAACIWVEGSKWTVGTQGASYKVQRKSLHICLTKVISQCYMHTETDLTKEIAQWGHRQNGARRSNFF